MQAYIRVDATSNAVEFQEVTVPQIDSHEVLIKMSAFGVGIHDRYFIPNDITFPYVIGIEGSGTILELGDEVKDFNINDRVILSSSLLSKGGCWARCAVVPKDNIVRLPDTIDFEEGAALPVAGKTAMECIRELDLTAGETLFIAGASGAIGTMVIQLAHNKGVRIIASASKKNHDYMKSLGADVTVDYNDANWKQTVLDSTANGVDVALAIQPDTAKDSMDVVKDNGTVITVSGDSINQERGIIVKQIEHKLTFQEALGDILDMVESGKLKIVIEKKYTFEQALEALEKTETRHARGKRVVTI